MSRQGRIRVALCQFAERFEPHHNAAVVCRHLRAAARRGADLVHVHEGALSGYLARPGAPHRRDYDWAALRQATLDVCGEARRLKVWVVLGSAHPLTPPHKPTNCLYLIGPDGRIRARYDKRFCMTADLRAYTPGDHFVVFTLNGVKCALLICFDLRFPELYRALARRGVQAVFQSFHNGYMDGPGIHTQIMRQTMQANCGDNYLWASCTNSSGFYSRWPGVLIRPDGTFAATLRQNKAGMRIATIDTGLDLYDPTRPFRGLAMRGRLHTGRLVRDPRLTHRRTL
jgi:deaminated glutathione amidase